jgi:WD40 repeat protein
MAVVGGGGQILTCGADGRIQLRNTGDGQLSREYAAALGATAIAYRSDNTRMATAGTDGKLRIWNPGDGSQLSELDGPTNVSAIAFSPDNQKLAVCGENRLTIYGPPAPPRPGVEWTLHQDVSAETAFTDVLFAADNRRLYAAHVSGHISEWAYAAPGPIRQYNHGGPVYGVAISSDNKTIVSCSGDQTVRVWDAATGQQRSQLNGHQGAVYGLALSADAALALSAGADNTLRLWDIAGGRQLKQLPSGGATVYSIAINPQGTLFATGGGDRKLRLYDLLTGNELRTIEGHTDFINRVTFNPKGDRLLSYGYAGHLMVWNPADGAKLYATQIGRVGNFADYSPDGTRVVLANGSGEALVVTLPAEGR